jgi:peptidoglycan/LPS O-acetylase OafA/YrhL
MAPRSQTIPELDGLRGIAVLCVLARHSVKVFHDRNVAIFPVGAWDAATPLVNGWIGVDLFFVLSGFLITHHLLKQLQSGALPLRTYVLKRALRIIPAYYAVLLMAVAGAVPGYAMPSDQPRASLLYHLAFLQDYLEPDIVPAFWSLGVEEKFYLLAPFLCLVAARAARTVRYGLFAGLFVLPLACRIITYLIRPELASYYDWFRALRSPFHVCLDGLVVGAACAFLYRSEGVKRVVGARPGLLSALFWCGAAVVGGLVGVFPLAERVNWFNATVLQSLLALGFGAIVFSVLWGGAAFAAPLRAAWLRFFARISYSLYLVHMLFMTSVFVLLDQWAALGRLPVWGQALVYLPVYCAVSVLAGLWLHYAVERPGLALKDRL